MSQQQILVITPDHIMNLHFMLEQLTARVDQIGTTLENIAMPVASRYTQNEITRGLFRPYDKCFITKCSVWSRLIYACPAFTKKRKKNK